MTDIRSWLIADLRDDFRRVALTRAGPDGPRVGAGSIATLRQAQAASLAYFDEFSLFAVLAPALVPLVLLMKRSVPEKGANIAAE
jgi:MFS transporter, DHA2 family, multidrug resistance protein